MTVIERYASADERYALAFSGFDTIEASPILIVQNCHLCSGKQVKHMGSLGMQEILVIFILALIIFGPRKLPEIGKSLGKGLAEFKKASNELKQTWEEEIRKDQEKEAEPKSAAGISVDSKKDSI